MREKQNSAGVYMEGQPAPSFKRLVVLVPDADLDEMRLARRLRTLMMSSKSNILLITPVNHSDQVLQERRRLTNLAAILYDPLYSVSTELISGSRWVDQLRQRLLPDDLMVCLSAQSAPRGGLKKKTLAQMLEGRLPCPLYVLQGVPLQEATEQKLVHQVIGWIVPIIMILLFMGFDIDIASNTAAGWIGTLLLWLVLLIEAGLIWGWNSLWN